MKILDIFKSFGQVPEKLKSYYGSQFLGTDRFALNWNTREYLATYKSSVYVYACVKKRAEKVGGIEFKLRKGINGDDIINNPYLDLLYRPNNKQSKNEFFETYQIFKDLAGSTFIWLEKAGTQVIGMHNLRPDQMTIKISKETGEVIGYEYQVAGKKIIFLPEEIIASHYSNPTDPIMGQSLVEACALSIYTERQLSEYQANVLKNGGKIEGILTHKVDNITNDQIKDIKLQWEKQYAEAKNSGKPLILYGGMEYQNLGLTPTELSYLDSKKLNRDDILTIFGVPRAILGTDSAGPLGGNGYEASLNIFLNETIKPLMDNLCQKLNEFLIPDGMSLYYEDPSPVNIDSNIKIVESGLKNYYMTPNEARGIMGLDPLPEMDTVLVPFNLMPYDSEPADTESPDDTDDDSEEKPADPEEKKALKHPLQDKDIRAKYWEQSRQMRTRTEKIFKKLILQYLQGQKNRITERLTNSNISTKSIIDDVFNFNEEDKLGVEILKPAITNILKENGQEAINLVGGKGTFKITSEIKRSLEKRAEFFVHEINKTSFNQMQKLFEDNMAGNNTRDDLIEGITNLYNDNITEGRANRIAQTETGVAMNEGRYDGYRQMGITIKIWVHRPIAITPREEHMEMDGEERHIDEPFSNGLMYPCDPDGEPEDVINCHCVL